MSDERGDQFTLASTWHKCVIENNANCSNQGPVATKNLSAYAAHMVASAMSGETGSLKSSTYSMSVT